MTCWRTSNNQLIVCSNKKHREGCSNSSRSNGSIERLWVKTFEGSALSLVVLNSIGVSIRFVLSNSICSSSIGRELRMQQHGTQFNWM